MFLLDLEEQVAHCKLDWNTENIEWHGVGGGRGLRGIACDEDRIYIAADNQLLAFTPEFENIGAWRCPYLMHCHGIAIWERTLYLTSAAFDSILGFDLDQQQFSWAMHVQSKNYKFRGSTYDPMSDDGPLALNKLQINNVYCNQHGMYINGLKTGGMLHFNGSRINMAVQLPIGSRDARPFRDGVIFNDTEAGVLRYTGRGEGEEDRAMTAPSCDLGEVTHTDALREGVAAMGFARGLCILSDRHVAGGSAPSTVSLYDLAENSILGSVQLTRDVRSSIHTIAQWRFD